MGTRSLTAKVNPAVLRWARESAGVTLAEVGKRLHISIDTVAAWERGERQPTVAALEELARAFKRPLAAFFLPRPPEEPRIPRDFRMLPGAKPPALSKSTRFAIRKAQRLQRVARNLFSELDLPCSVLVGRATARSNAEKITPAERAKLGVDLERQFAWVSAYQALRAWRSAVESLNVVVFQLSMPLRETRGFSLTEADPPAIVINATDAINARIFTLFHEYAHIVLHTGGLCLVEESMDLPDSPVETFCNRFAGALLVPADALQARLAIRKVSYPGDIDDQHLRAIAKDFKVSKEVIWRRMFLLELIAGSTFRARLSRWESEPKPATKPWKRRLAPAQRSVHESGVRLTTLVVEARERDLISYRDASDYLSLAPGDLRKVEGLIGPAKR
ncbi:MAG: XRE family transcriptional regulator [Phycisphaerae bacterium]|nr:XRE family transcriptional regulator [Phycisphaerae bacterium]